MDVAIVSLIGATVVSAYAAGLKAIDLAKAKIAAVTIANQKMEEIRNMSYDSLATVHGPIYPAGQLLDSSQITVNGIIFTASTVISYVDDPFDGNADGSVANKQVDLYPYDYKKAEITVTKSGKSVVLARLTSNIAAKAAETPGNTGIIKVCVVDAASQPVPLPNITIQNTVLSPPVDIRATADIYGCLMVPALPPDQQNNYHIVATKDGYSTDMTYPRTSQNPNALQPDVDVSVQQVTNQILTIDRTSTMKIAVKDKNGAAVANSAVHIESKVEKYFNPSTPVYSNDATTDANGEIRLTNLAFGNYIISLSDWIILSTSPYQPSYLVPGSDQTVNVSVSHSEDDLIIKTVDPVKSFVGQTVSLTVTGANFTRAATAQLVNVSGTEIAGTVNFAHTDTIEIDFNLSSAAVGQWDILISDSDGRSVRQINGFEVASQ